MRLLIKFLALLMLMQLIVLSQDGQIKLYKTDTDSKSGNNHIFLYECSFNAGDSVFLKLDQQYSGLKAIINIDSYIVDSVRVYIENALGYEQIQLLHKNESGSLNYYNAVSKELSGKLLSVPFSTVSAICFVAGEGNNKLVVESPENIKNRLDSARLVQSELSAIRKDFFIKVGEELAGQYESAIAGHSYNAIADYLYNQGFGRDYKYGSVLKTDFYKSFCFDDNYMQVPYPEGECVRLHVYLWYSYGYGDLYYKVEYSLPYRYQ